MATTYNQEAGDALRRARTLEVQGRQADAARAYGDAAAYLRADGRLDAAARAYESAGDVGLAAKVHLENGNPDAAARLLEKGRAFAKAAKLFEGRGAWADAARCHAEDDQHDRAVLCWLKADRTLEAARSMLRCGRQGDALELLGHAAERGSSELAIAQLAMDALESQSTWLPAAAAPLAVLQLHAPDDTNTLDWLRSARLLERLGQVEEAAAAWERLKAIPEFTDAAGDALRRLAGGKVGARTFDLDEAATDPEERSDSPSFEGRVVAERYRMGSIIGRGSMGVVQVATHIALQRTVAIKTLLPCAPDKAAHRESLFLREARAASRLYHPNVVQVLDFGHDEQLGPFLVMEYLDGTPLSHLLLDQPPGPSQSVRLMTQVLTALEAAHASEILHRDVKPGNILIQDPGGEQPYAKVVDFGIARAMDDTRATATTGAHGTPLYMAPEQIDSAHVDARADLYAATTVLYECLVGHPPFHGGSLISLLKRKVTKDPPPASASRSGAPIPRPLQELLARGLCRDPEGRIPTARALRRALEPYASETAWPDCP